MFNALQGRHTKSNCTRHLRWTLDAKHFGWAAIALGLLAASAVQATTQDITGQFAITRSGLVLNRATNTFDSTVTLRNTSSTTVIAPINAAISGLPTSVTLANRVDKTPDGKPYVSPMSAGSLLQPGGTLPFVLTFANPAPQVAFQSIVQILYTVAAPPNAPTLISVAATGGTSAFVVGRVDGAANQTISVQASSAPTCFLGSLVGAAPVGGPVTVTTDSDGYFGVTVAGVNPGGFVAVNATSSTTSPTSSCLVSSRDNDSWPKAFPLVGSPVFASDFIDSPGKARWYKFSVTPGQRIEVRLSGLPADYDLAVFKDIGQAFQSQFNPATAGTADLLKLTAEYAPSAFSPSAFSPSAFSPSAFSPSAFSPSAFSPSVFSPSAFSPSAFSPSAFSPSAFSPSAFSPSAFSPSAFSPSAFSPSVFTDAEIKQAFSTAQTRSIIGVSAMPGTGDESIVVNSWNNTGSFYVRVTGRGGAFDTNIPFTIGISKGPTTCTGVTDTTLIPRSALAASGLRTVILTDSSKVALDATLPIAGGGTLRDKLSAFAARTEIMGVLVDVASDARVSALKQQAANNPACPFAKNLVAEEIKGIVDTYRANPLRYIVIVGNDDAIPFFRSPDQSGFGDESSYVPPVQSNSASEASLRLNFVLSQDRYGSTTSISLPTNEFPVPRLAVGRLIETATEIAGVIDAYGAVNGVVVPGSALVTGYDFLEDAANAVSAELQSGIGRVPDALITPNGKSPQDPLSWTATQLRQKLLGSRHDVIFLAGHFSANSALAADFSTSLLTTDLVASTVDLTNSIVFSAGCHAGYNLVDTAAIPGVTLSLDWAQAFARKKSTLVAGTGYQYGDTDFLEYSERLYNRFARQLRAGAGAIAVGEALVKAKIDYLTATPDIRGIHEKVLLEATLFGLPMLGVNMPSGRGGTSGGGGVITPSAVASGPAHELGLKTYDLGVSPSLLPHTVALKNVEGGPNIIAHWLSGPDGVVTKPGEPALPLAAVNVTPTDPNIVLRGVGFRGGAYVDSLPLFPFSGAPTTELRGVHVPFLSPVFFPGRMWSPNYFGALAGSGSTDLLVTPAQHRAANIADGTSTQRKFTGLDLRLYYSGNLSQAALSEAPSIVGVEAQPDAGGVLFAVQVIGDPAAAIHQVWITYTSDGVGAWTSVDLSQCAAPLPAVCGASDDSRLWKGRLASAPTNARFLVQAVSGVGLVATDDNRGAYYGLAAATPAATAIALVSPPTSAAIGDTVDIKARLTFAGVPVIGKLVTIAIGDAVQLGTTGSDGSVTVKVLMATDPGTYQIAASFAGDDAFQPCSTTASFVVGKAVSSLAALTPAGATLTGVLGGNTEVLQQEAVAFSVTGPAGPITISAITDYVGRAKLPPPGMLAGTYTVTQASFGGNATYAAANVTLAQQFIVAKTAQSITFDALAGKTLGDPDFPVFATASSGLAVSFAANGTCTVLGNTVHIAGVGSCTITATQGGDANNNPAPQALRSFAIAPVNTAAPTVTSLVRAMPSPAMVATVSYTLTFGKPVTGVASGNFALVTAGIAGASIATISGIGTTWTVSVNSGHGTGSLRLDLINGTGISDAQGNALAGTPFTGQTYQIDKGGTVIGTGEGQPVPGFGSSGYALFSDVQTVAAPSAIAVLADGRILAAGGIGCQPGSSSYCTLQIAQYLASGAPDTAFGTVGRMLTAVTNINPELSALIVNADGTFFVNGSRNNGTAEVPFAAKFTSAGAPVTTFGTNGLASLDSLPLGLGVSGSAIDGSGRIVIAGTTPDAGAERNDIFVTRLTGAGAIDATFGNNGIAQFAISTVDARSDRGTTVAVQPNGMIVVGGRTLVTSGLDFDFLLLRLDATGALDSSFGNGGIATTRFAGSTGGNFGRKLVLQPDGKIALVGSVIVGPSNHCGVARFNANGTLDNTFGSGGHVLEAVTLGCFDVSLRTDGKLVIVASDQVAGVTYGTILRLLPAGAPDGAFGNGGFLDISSFGTPGRAAFTSGGNLVTSLVIEDPADGVPKSYVVQLGASGGSNQPPVADAGPDQTVTAGATVQMTSAGSGDPEGNPLSYVWSFTSKPNASTAHFSNSNAANPTFIADKKGTYVAQLIVNDGGAPPLDSAPDTVQITATNRAPVAVADSYSVAQGGTLVVSAATGMLANDTDADGDTLTAASVSTVTHGALTLNPDGGFTYTPSATYTGPDSFTYRANDGASNSNTATVSLSVTTGNLPPVANAGANQNVTVGQSVQLNGTCTDADGDATTRAWGFTSKPAGSTAALSDPTVVNPSFIPDLAGSYQLRLICNDGHVDSSPSPVTIAASTSTISAGLASPLTGIGQTVGGTITLSTAAPVGGVQVTVVSSDTGVATVAPSPVTVAAGTTTGSFTVTGVALGTATLTASATGYTAGSVDIAVTGSVTVTNTDDSGVGSLRDAIAQANLAPGPNTIDFAPGVVGTILLTSGQIRIDGPLTIVGPGRDVLAIDGNQSGRIFTIIENNAPACPALSGPSDFVVSISGLTLQNGSRNVVDSGGGAIQSAKSLVLAAVTIRDSQAKSGGGLVFNAQYPGQTLTIANSKFIDNVAKPVAAGNTGAHNGGALLVHDYCPETRIAAVVTISGSEFSGNRVQPVELEGRGGGIAAYLATGFVTISDTRIVDNHVEPPIPPVAGFNYPGGGVQTTSKSVTIQRSEIAGNSADYGGGFSVTADASDLQAPEDAFAYLLVDSTVSGNVANQSGGGINVHANVTAVIANSTVNGNAAPANRTGGIRVSNGPTFPASAINSTPPTLTLISSIVANNSGADVGGLPSTFIPSPYTLNSTDSLIGVDPGPDFFVVGNVIGGNPQLAALAFNGGPTRTHALLSGSPAIDAGSNPLGLTTDQRGAGFPREAGARADIGAYEAPAITNHAPVANAGSNQNGIVGQPVQLNGSCTDADGDTTTRTWSFTSKPVGSTAALSSATILNPTFTPDLPGSYQLQLICNDGHVDSSPSSVVITVAPNAISLTPASPLLGVGRTINGTITLPQPAPAGGVAVALSSANIAIATVAPSSVTIPGGSTTGSFTVTGVALGGPVTLTGSAAGFASGTTSVTVTNTLISLGTLPAIGLGQNVSLPISLTAPAPAGGVTVNFTSNDTSIATVTASVFIAAGQTIPVSNPQVNGVNIGSAQITALAPGFAPDTRTANVQVNVTFTPTTLNVVLSASQNITVNISAPAPAGGLTVGLTTANPAIATVASPITIPAGQLSAPAAVTGVSVGTTTLQATGSGVTSGSATINVTPAPALTIGNQTIGKDLQVQPSLSLGAPAPAGGLMVTLTSSDPSKVLLSTSATAAGSASIAVTIPAGQPSNNTFFIQSLSDTGTATVTASATGYATSVSTMTMAASGFYNSSPGGNFTTTTFSTNTLLRVASARLNATGAVQSGQELRGGLTVSVPVTVVDVTGTNVGSITVSPVVFNGGDNFKDTAFDPLSAGTAQISVGVPAGFSTPLASQRQITATVTAPALTIGNQTIGKDLQVQPSLSLGAPAPAGGLMVTLTSSDPSKVLLSTSATAAGSASIAVTIPAGQPSNNTFFIQSLSDTGTATVTASATGYATSVSTMTMAASGFYNSSPGGNFTTTTFSTNTLLRVASARLNATGAVQSGQELRGGLTVSVPVTVVDVTGTNVGSITVSPVVFNGGDNFKDTAFDPLSAGTAQISVGVPAGFSTPLASQRQITATVTAPALTIGNQTIGKDLQVQPALSLGAPAPAGGLMVTLTSSDPSKVLLSTSATAAGSASIAVTIPAGQPSNNTFFIQSLSDTGTATVTASATGYATSVSTMTMAASGFYNSSPGGNFTTTTFSTNTLLRVASARLNATGAVQSGQELRGGLTVSVPVTVVDVTGTNVGSITVSPVVFNGGDNFKDTAFDPLSAGTAQISVGVPAGFSTPLASQRQITATVTAPGISSGNVVVGRNLQTAVSISLGVAPPSPVNVTVTLASGTIAAISNSATVLGGTTLTFNNVTTTSVGTFFVHGLALGATLITVQAPGYSDDTSTVTVQPSGFANTSPGGNFSTTTLSGNTLFRVQPARLDPTTLNVAAFQALRAGLTVDVPVTSGTPAVGTITASPVTFSGGDSLKDTAFDPASAGTTLLTVGVPAGFDTPSNSRQITATVN